LEPVRELVKVEFGGIVLAQSTRTVRVLETASPPTFYVPPDDVLTQYLQLSPHVSFCEWKGKACYWTVEIGGCRVENIAWSYPDPTPRFSSIRDYFSFYAGKTDACLVGKHKVIPQPGCFYGGWITPGVIGPFKGEPGTEGW
jgi:uncharacterized protein (DUF427 family)